MIYLRSVVIGVVSCLILVLMLYFTTDGLLPTAARGVEKEALMLLALSLEAATLGYWATEYMLPADEQTGQLVTVGLEATLMRLVTAIAALAIFAATMGYIYSSWSVVMDTFQSRVGYVFAISVFIACQLVHYLGPDYLLKKRV